MSLFFLVSMTRHGSPGVNRSPRHISPRTPRQAFLFGPRDATGTVGVPHGVAHASAPTVSAIGGTRDENGTDIFRPYSRPNPFRGVLIRPYPSLDI
jgi:hypothetical protein